MHEPFGMAGRVALVTGAGRGIGRETAHVLAALGAMVAVCDRDREPAEETCASIRAAGGHADALVADVVDRADMEASVMQIVAQHERLDIVVACAGVTRDASFHKMTDEEWDSVIDSHLRGAFLVTQAAQAVMVPAGYGRIVLFSSASALGNRGQANYSAAKAGVQGLTRTLAIELGRYGITVNAVAPGFIETRMTAAVAERTGRDFEQIKQAAAVGTALGRVGQPADVAGVAAFLASDAASYVTGQTVYVQGTP